MRLLITAGPTREPLDPVRFISNASTGAQGAALAREAIGRGWEVDVVHGPIDVDLPAEARSHPVVTTTEMLARCVELHAECDAVIGAAAPSDYRAAHVLDHKHKRSTEAWSVELVPTVDVLATLGARKGSRTHVGFALESRDLEAGAARKLERKNLDWIVGNPPTAIGASASEYLLLGRDGTRQELGRLRKEELAARILDLL